MTEARWGAIEGGGTKFICAIGSGPEAIDKQVRIDTRGPEETLAEVVAFFQGEGVAGLGLAMFGPLELRPGTSYGAMLSTPKPGWSGFPVRAYLAEALSVPVSVDTDVNAAALAEQRWGAARGLDPVVYITVGTGIGGGVVTHGQPLHGLMHPELGHLLVPALRDGEGRVDDFEGVCPFHGRCLEGVASGPALRKRLGHSATELAPDHPLWVLEARYLAFGLMSTLLFLSPMRIVIGGGVMSIPHLLPRVRRELQEMLAGYVPRAEVIEGLDDFVVSPGLPVPGLSGAFALAMLPA